MFGGSEEPPAELPRNRTLTARPPTSESADLRWKPASYRLFLSIGPHGLSAHNWRVKRYNIPQITGCTTRNRNIFLSQASLRDEEGRVHWRQGKITKNFLGSMSYCESDVDFSDKAISIHRHAWG